MTPTTPTGAWDKRADMLVHGADPFNAEPPPQALVEHFVTPVRTFYSRNHGPVPNIDPQTWLLTVEGLVDEPAQLSLEDLRRRWPTHSLTATLQCAGNRRAGLVAVRDIPGEDPWRDGATSTAQWTGVRLSDVLASVRPTSGATDVAFAAPDVSELADPPQPYGGSVPIDKALSSEVLLAWAMNGEPLSPVHGAPLRVVVPGWIGARSVKWLQRITVQASPSDNYFQASAYRLLPGDAAPGDGAPGDGACGITLGPIALNSAILEPVDAAQIPAGPTVVRGYAFAGDGRRVMRVDVSADGGRTWRQADLGVDSGRWSWRLWSVTLEVGPGDAELVARAWDDAAALQPADPADVWNPKGYVNNSWPRIGVHATDTPAAR